MPNRKKVLRHRLARNKIKKLAKLRRIVARHKKQGQRIVTTNGTYDLLHVGHIRTFERAKKLGDVLIVGVNSDASVRAYKGPKRPILSEQERAELVAALESVDYVLIFSEPNPVKWLTALQPHVHVKGGDWQKKNMPEWEPVERHGGKMVRVPIRKGYSTTNIIQKILEAHG
ncbi:MAG: adenylyltransferase/cytidyltransferase family protein [Candidatus Liptonbacteria bacterium]|nr:adenylyltransferase/cytidyltransferase family protein [Candidatus Liptonbacteria bacterium]